MGLQGCNEQLDIYCCAAKEKEVKIYDRVKNLKHTLTKAIYHHGMVSEKNKITVIKKNAKQAQHTCV